MLRTIRAVAPGSFLQRYRYTLFGCPSTRDICRRTGPKWFSLARSRADKFGGSKNCHRWLKSRPHCLTLALTAPLPCMTCGLLRMVHLPRPRRQSGFALSLSPDLNRDTRRRHILSVLRLPIPPDREHTITGTYRAVHVIPLPWSPGLFRCLHQLVPYLSPVRRGLFGSRCVCSFWYVLAARTVRGRQAGVLGVSLG